MAVRARDDLTLAQVTEVQNVRRYYKLVPGTASAPAAPTTVPPASGSGWETTEPGYTPGSSDVLYVVDVTILTDGAFDYTPVSKSSAYEAARQAYNKAVAALEAAETGTVAISRLVAGQAVMGDLVTQTLAARIGAFIELSAEQIVAGTIAANRINVEDLAATLATILTLNVDRLTATSASMATAVVDKLWADVVRSRKITADMVLIPAGKNLAVDPNFANPAAWATPAHIQTTGGKLAPGSLLIPASATTVTSYAGTQPEYLIPVHPGEKYRVTATFKPGATVSAANRFSIGVRYRTSAGGTTALTTVVQNTASVAANAEAELTGVITVPANATHMAIGFTKASVLNSTLRVTDYLISSMVDASLVVEGSLKAANIDVNDLVASAAFIQALTAGTVVADALSGATVTGAIIRSAATGVRVALDRGNSGLADWGLRFYNQFNQSSGEIVGRGDSVLMRAGAEGTAAISGSRVEIVNSDSGATVGDMRYERVHDSGVSWWAKSRYNGSTYQRLDTLWQDLTLISGWTPTPGWPTPQWRLREGKVELRGRISGTAAAGTTMFRLPLEARPLAFGDVIVLPGDASGYARVAVYTRLADNANQAIDGNVFLAGKAGAITGLSLDGLPLWSVVP